MVYLAFLRREVLRKAKRAAAAKKRRRDNACRINHICEMYEDAYWKWTKEHIRVRYHRGWYYIEHHGRLREKGVIEATNRMFAQLHEEEMGETT